MFPVCVFHLAPRPSKRRPGLRVREDVGGGHWESLNQWVYVRNSVQFDPVPFDQIDLPVSGWGCNVAGEEIMLGLCCRKGNHGEFCCVH